MAGVKLRTDGGFSGGFAGGMAMMGDLLDRQRAHELDIEKAKADAAKARSGGQTSPKTLAEANRIASEDRYGMAQANVADKRATTAKTRAESSKIGAEMLSEIDGNTRSNLSLPSEIAERNAAASKAGMETVKGMRESDQAHFENQMKNADAIGQRFYKAFSAARTPEQQQRVAEFYDGLMQKHGFAAGKFTDAIDGPRLKASRELESAINDLGNLGGFNETVSGRDEDTYYAGEGSWREQDKRENEMEAIERRIVDSINVLNQKGLQKGDGKNKRITHLVPVANPKDKNGNPLEGMYIGLGIRSETEDEDGNTKINYSDVTVDRSSRPEDPVKLLNVNNALDYYGAQHVLMENLDRVKRQGTIMGWYDTEAQSTAFQAAKEKLDEDYNSRANKINETYLSLAAKEGIDADAVLGEHDAAMSELHDWYEGQKLDTVARLAPHMLDQEHNPVRPQLGLRDRSEVVQTQSDATNPVQPGLSGAGVSAPPMPSESYSEFRQGMTESLEAAQAESEQLANNKIDARRMDAFVDQAVAADFYSLQKDEIEAMVASLDEIVESPTADPDTKRKAKRRMVSLIQWLVANQGS